MQPEPSRSLPAGLAVALASLLSATAAGAVGFAPAISQWETVVNNGDNVPGTAKLYNSYNQPAVNANGLVVFRARSRGPQRASGIYTRQMPNGVIDTVADLNTTVPEPNNTPYPTQNGGEALGTFNEFPSIPSIAINGNKVATRGNHQPVWTPPEGEEEREGTTTGVYVDLNANSADSLLVTGASKLGGYPEFAFFEVPGATPGIYFDVFPGRPAITDQGLIAFKGNYTENGIAKTGVFFRALAAATAGGDSPVQLIANTGSVIPNLPAGMNGITFGSTAPPTAADSSLVFVGLDNEAAPQYGGIYRAPLASPFRLTTLVGLGMPVPGLDAYFTRLGEGLSYDGRLVSFWAAWGTETPTGWKTVRLYCPQEGNKDRQAYCSHTRDCSVAGGCDPNSVQDPATGEWYQEKPVPVSQGVFVYDTQTGQMRTIARTPDDFADFEYWNYSGKVSCTPENPCHEGGGEEDGEEPRWRSAAFTAVSGNGANFRIAFKARTGATDQNHVYADPVDGIYFVRGPGQPQKLVLAETGMPGTLLDPEAADSATNTVLPITALGVERDGFRGNELVINARMGLEGGAEESGWAGIYLTRVQGLRAPR